VEHSLVDKLVNKLADKQVDRRVGIKVLILVVRLQAIGIGVNLIEECCS